MSFLKASAWSLVLLILIPCAFADAVRISQIDTSHLLFNQEVTLFVSVTDQNGNAIEHLDRNQFSITESADGRTFNATSGVTSFQVGSNYETGVNFLLLVDNSESMYWTMEGEKTDNTSRRRMTYARRAISAFLKSMTNPRDKVGLAAYNTHYRMLAEPAEGTAHVDQALQEIERPTGSAIYSEIYGSLALAVDELQRLKGRKAIIILSDGVNNPSYRHTKEINPQFGQKSVPYQQPLEALQREGISLYVINFGPRHEKKDRYLIRIAGESGGATFSAYNQQGLKQIYLKIMDQILKEYILSYRANMSTSEKKRVRVTLEHHGRKVQGSRIYYASPLFGAPLKSVNILILLTFVLACLLLWLLSRIRFEKQHIKPTIEVMTPGPGNPSTQILTLDNQETIIGSAAEADMTIAGIPDIENHHATIIYDKNKDQYRLRGETKIMVNNQQVTTKVLESGDLINLNGMTIVFDEGREKEEK